VAFVKVFEEWGAIFFGHAEKYMNHPITRKVPLFIIARRRCAFLTAPSTNPNLKGDPTMRFMIIVKATRESEAG